MNEFIIKEYPVYSKKHDIHGIIKDMSFLIMLEFKYEDNLDQSDFPPNFEEIVPASLSLLLAIPFCCHPI